jgi:hypothetical protein
MRGSWQPNALCSKATCIVTGISAGGMILKIVEGWRRIDNQRGYINEITGQNLAVTKKEFGEHYLVLLFADTRNEDEGRKISPVYQTKSKADSYAQDWMNKHPRGFE